MILDALYWLAAGLALIGAFTGNRVAWPLLASFAFCQTVRWQGWPFDRDVWAAVDSAVMLAIGVPLFARWRRCGAWPSVAEWLVIGLFAPAVAAYAIESRAPMTAYVVSSLAAIAQLLLAFPAGKAWLLLKKASRDLVSKDDFDLMAAV